jgi:transcriptional regulator with XRE-family HTH domain
VGEPDSREAACRALGQRLAALRTAAGLSQPQLAPLVGYSRSTVANAETGRRPAARDFWRRCDHVLATGGVLVRAYDELAAGIQQEHEAARQAAQAARLARIQQTQQHPWTTWQRDPAAELGMAGELSLIHDGWDADQSNTLAALLDEATLSVPAPTVARLIHEWLVVEPPHDLHLQTGRRIGEQLVASVEQRVVQLRHLDDFVGGRDLHTLVESQLAATGRLLREGSYTDPLGRRLFVAIGELCQLAGWVAADAGQPDRAAHYFALGVKAAHAAGDQPLAANLISTLAYQVSNTGNPLDGVLLAQTAASGAQHAATSTAQALFHERVAWAHAKAGNRRSAEQALVKVEQAYDRRQPDDDPEWTYWLNEDEITIMAARCYVELGQSARATPLLTDVLNRYDEQRTREAALYTSWLAEAHIYTGDIDQAAELASKTAILTAHTSSTRSDQRLTLLRTKLTPHKGTAAVDDFLALSTELA